MERDAEAIRTRVEGKQFVTVFAIDTDCPVPGSLETRFHLPWKGDWIKVTNMHIDRDRVEISWVPVSDGGLLTAY